MRIRIRGGRVVDPANGVDGVSDLFLDHGRIVAVGRAPAHFEARREIDARDRVVCPGLIDLGAHLREPGEEHKATIASETRAAARAGITTLCCPPDTDPVVDTPAVAELIHQRAEHAGHAKVVPLGALTVALAGEALAELQALKEIGCAGVSNARRPIANTEVLRRAYEYAATCGLTVFIHPQDPWLGRDGCMHEGAISTRLGIPAVPETAETIGLSRDLLLIEQTGVRAHFCRISTGQGARMIRDARRRGLAITADVGIHYLHATDEDVGYFDSRYHVQPPLRGRRDRQRLRRAVAGRAIEVICSDHQPHDRDAKNAPFSATRPGISALETLLPQTLALVSAGVLGLNEAIAALTEAPARVLGSEAGHLGVGAPADVCIFDPDASWTVTEETLASAGKNTPLLGRELRGRVTHTLLGGRLVHGG